MVRVEHQVNWMVVKLSRIIKKIESGVSVNGDGRPAGNSEVGVLKVSAVTSGRFKPMQNKVVIDPSEQKRLKCPISCGDILMTRANGSADLVGACVFARSDHPNLFLSDKIWKLIIEDNQRDCSEWLYYLLTSAPLRQRILDASSGSVGMRNVSKDGLLGITVYRPPYAVQKKIANMLSIWDRAIELIEKLITAKSKRKLAIMQLLFAGKTRLPGFKGQWKKCYLGDVAMNSSGRNGKPTHSSIVYSVTNSVGMIPMDEDIIGDSIERYKTVSRFDFAYNPMRINVGSIAMWDGDDDVLVSPDYVVFRCGPGLDAEFLNHFRKSYYWHQFVNSSGGGSVRVRIYFSDLADMKLNLPPIDEQKAIAAVLSTQERGLDLLRRKCNALKEQKKGLMQKLLTGTVGVKCDSLTTCSK